LGSATQPHSAVEVGGWLLSFLPTSASWQTIGKSNGSVAVFTRILAAANSAKALNLDRRDVIVVRDTPYNAEAAGNAGLCTIDVLCGGFPENGLRKAGCIAIYQDPADLLAQYEGSPLSNAPVS